MLKDKKNESGNLWFYSKRNLFNDKTGYCTVFILFIYYWRKVLLLYRFILIFLEYSVSICTTNRLSDLALSIKSIIHTILQNKRMRRCGVAPPTIIFERLKLPQQIIYRQKGNLSESPNHKKYWKNILVSRFYE